MNNNKVGVFDSGIGGLSVFSRLIKMLPNENYIYFGDTLHLPYGNKTKEELIEISLNIFDFFKEKGVKAVVMACNTTSATVYDVVKSKYDFEIYPIVQNVSNCIANKGYKRIGVFATNATVNSHAYKKELQKCNSNLEVFETACPTWVSIVENSLQKEEKSIENIKMMMDIMLKNKVDKIILGCTHYPYLLNVLSEFAPREIFIDPAEYFAQFIANDLSNKQLLNTEQAEPPKFYVSSSPKQFENSSTLFYKVNNIEPVSLNKIIA